MLVMCLKSHWTFSRLLPMTQGFSIACQVKWRMWSSDALSHWSAVTKGFFWPASYPAYGAYLNKTMSHVGQVRLLQSNMAPSLPYMNKKPFIQDKVLSLQAPHHASFADKRPWRPVIPCAASVHTPSPERWILFISVPRPFIPDRTECQMSVENNYENFMPNVDTALRVNTKARNIDRRLDEVKCSLHLLQENQLMWVIAGHDLI